MAGWRFPFEDGASPRFWFALFRCLCDIDMRTRSSLSARYVLVLVESLAERSQVISMLPQNRAVLFGSGFPKDQDSITVHRHIHSVKNVSDHA